MTDRELFQQLQQLREHGVHGCLATIVEAAGSTPRDVGAKMILCANGLSFGSVGGGCGENQVKSAALRGVLNNDRSAELLEIDLTDELGVKGGDVCGGTMKILIEPF